MSLGTFENVAISAIIVVLAVYLWSGSRAPAAPAAPAEAYHIAWTLLTEGPANRRLYIGWEPAAQVCIGWASGNNDAVVVLPAATCIGHIPVKAAQP